MLAASICVAGATTVASLASPAAASAQTVNRRAVSAQAGTAPVPQPATVRLPPPPSTNVYKPPASIATDCSVNVTPALLTWIATVPDNSTLSFATNGCYRIDDSLVLWERNGLTFEGNGATFRAFTISSPLSNNAQERRHIWFRGGSNITLRDLTVRGVNTDHKYHTAYAFQAGITLWGVQGALIDNVNITEVYGDYVTIANSGDAGSPNKLWPSDITIRNSTFSFAGRQGFGISAGQHLAILNNVVNDPSLDYVDIEPDSSTVTDAQGHMLGDGVKDFSILSNTFNGRSMFFANTGHSAVTDGVQIRNNTIHGATIAVWVVGTPAQPRGDFVIANNTSDAELYSPRGLMEFTSTFNVSITGNTQAFYAAAKGQNAAVEVWGSNNVTVTSNVFADTTNVMVVDGARFGVAWTGAASTRCSETSNNKA